MDIQRWDRAKEKIGNTFELTVLIQKRVRELVKEKQRPLVDFEHRNPIQVALEEVLQDKIYLAPPAPAVTDSEPTVGKRKRAPAAAADPTAAPKDGTTSLIESLDEEINEDDESTTKKKATKAGAG